MTGAEKVRENTRKYVPIREEKQLAEIIKAINKQSEESDLAAITVSDIYPKNRQILQKEGFKITSYVAGVPHHDLKIVIRW